MSTEKRVLFVIQGEGRGHMTQAIAMKRILEQNGFAVSAAMIGSSSQREIPGFVREQLGVPITRFRSPNFERDPQNKGLRIGATIWKNLFLAPLFLGNLRIINRTIRRHEPALIINFYEPLLGMHHLLHRKRARVVCLAHQYLTLIPCFEKPDGHRINRAALHAFTRITAFRADLMLGLSFYPFEADHEHRVRIVPPLLRREVRELPTTRGDYLLVYLLNEGYKSEIVNWHNRHPETEIHCFTDDRTIKDEQRVDATLTFHQLSGEKFLRMMAGARALVSTAGFESICEGMYMGKPALMVPVVNHYEQFLNSRDAFKAGAGVYASHFDIDKLMELVEKGYRPPESFREWVDRAEPLVAGHLKRLLAR